MGQEAGKNSLSPDPKQPRFVIIYSFWTWEAHVRPAEQELLG